MSEEEKYVEGFRLSSVPSFNFEVMSQDYTISSSTDVVGTPSLGNGRVSAECLQMMKEYNRREGGRYAASGSEGLSDDELPAELLFEDELPQAPVVVGTIAVARDCSTHRNT